VIIVCLPFDEVLLAAAALMHKRWKTAMYASAGRIKVASDLRHDCDSASAARWRSIVHDMVLEDRTVNLLLLVCPAHGN
jgi:hypothetical protein